MGDFIKNIKLKFKQGDILIKLIFINVVVFFLMGAFDVICTLFKIQSVNVINYVGVSSSITEAIKHFWTFFTYMFVHANFFHIFFNMLVFYWFGKIFLTYFTPKNLGGLYILGGIGGALLYIVAFNTIPYYIDMGAIPMVGASAAVTAIIFAAAFYRPNAEVGLLLIGRIKIIYIAIAIFIIDFLALGSPANPGGHIAHIGGAIVGFIFAKQYLKGKDITAWMNKLIDNVINLFKPRPKKKMTVKVNKNKRSNDYEYNQRKNEETAEIDTILDKIKASGYSSLSKDEKKRLFDASNK